MASPVAIPTAVSLSSPTPAAPTVFPTVEPVSPTPSSAPDSSVPASTSVVEIKDGKFVLDRLDLVSGGAVVFANKDEVEYELTVQETTVVIGEKKKTVPMLFSSAGTFEATLSVRGGSGSEKKSTCTIQVTEQVMVQAVPTSGGARANQQGRFVQARGEELKQLVTRAQLYLLVDGIYNGPVTGTLDSQTKASIANYQEARGLQQTYVLDSETLKSMRIMPPANYQV